MSLDDELRRALEEAAPGPVDPRPVRAELRPTLRRARTRHRVRTAATSGVVAVALVGGTVALLAGGGRDDRSQVGPLAGEGTSTTTEAPTSTTVAAPTTTVVAGPTSTSPATSPTTPVTPSPSPTTTATTTSAPTATTTSAPPPPATPRRLETPCGAATFAFDGATISVTDITDRPGYTGVVDRESPVHVEVEWSVAGSDEEACKAKAELEGGVVEYDTEP